MKRYLPLAVILTAFLLCCVAILAGCSDDDITATDQPNETIPYITVQTTGPETEPIWIEGTIIATSLDSNAHSTVWRASVVLDGETERRILESGCRDAEALSVLYIAGDYISFAPGNDYKVCLEEIGLRTKEE